VGVFETLEKKGRYIIAEIGVNYYDIARVNDISPFDAAKLMIAEAAGAGVDAVKFQSYKASTLASKNSPAYWDTSEESTTSQYELFKKFDAFGQQEYEALAHYTAGVGVDFLSTPFDFESADYLDGLMPAYKISSSDLTNLPFISHIAQKGKPILLSVGAADQGEMMRAVETIKRDNEQPLALLHCVLEYPTPYEHANLARIPTLQREFPGCAIGYSDHTKPDDDMSVVMAAYILGARIIEKHFTLDKTLKGNDHYHAMDPLDMHHLLAGITAADTILGNPSLDHSPYEASARSNARRSIVATRDIGRGERIEKEALTFKRPGTGISPSELDTVVGAVAMEDIPADAVILPGMIETRSK
jgi:N-acetylneuraminate synthase